MFPGEKYMGFTFFFNGFLTIISTVKKEEIVYDNFFMTLILFTGFIEYAYNPSRDDQITIFSFSCSVFASWVGYILIQQHRNLKELCEVRGKNLRRDLKEKTDLKNKLIETSINKSILEENLKEQGEQYKTLLKEYKKQNENMKTLLLSNMFKHQRIGENCLTGKSELSELIEMFDDSKEKISDGEYLTLMNKSKKIYENFEKIRLANM
jgi:dGTP triphosphohydrolase